MSGTGVGDWMRLRCGDRVREHEGRHVGRVEAIHHSSVVCVRWEDTGWVSEFALGELRNLTRFVRPEDRDAITEKEVAS